MTKKKTAFSRPIQALLMALMAIALVVLVNVVAGFIPVKVDLTEEKRYTLTPATKQLLREVQDPIQVRVLFGGDFPAGIKRLQTSVREILDDFRAESGYIDYVFENPYDGPTEDVNQAIENFRKEGIVPMNMRFEDVDGTTEVFGYPYALFYYGGRYFPVRFLESVPGLHPEENLDNSIAQLEYKFASAISRVQSSGKRSIAFTTGHGELDSREIVDLRRSLEQYYSTGLLNMDSIYYIPPDDFAAVVVAKPRQAFPEKHKFILDQYIMAGGKVLWLIDPLSITMDSLRQRNFIPPPIETGLDDLFFSYGFRINDNLVLDLQNARIPQVIDAQGNVDLFNWFYFPVVTPDTDHPILQGIDDVWLQFPASIDTVRTQLPLKKTYLLKSSEYSRLQYSPVRVDFEILRYDPLPEKFSQPHQPMGLLVEGAFASHYRNRVTQPMLETLEQIGKPFREQGVPTSMMIIADGDIARNGFDRRTGGVRPLGYNPYEKKVFANRDLLFNALEYMIDDNDILSARGKEVKTRLLNTVAARDGRLKYQLLNIALPLVLLLILGWVFHLFRHRRYGRQKSQAKGQHDE